MNTPINIKGEHFTVEGKKLNIGPGLCWGYKTEEGMWAIWHPKLDWLGLGWPQEMDPSPVKANIEKVIKTVADAGNEDLIDHVGLNPLAFVQFWCEGVLTPDMFEAAVETEEYVEVSGVDLLGKPRKVRVYAEPENSMATYTTEGEVV